jgi:hypothetical protein
MIKKFSMLILSIILVCTLVFGFSSAVIAAPPDNQDTKGPPLDKVVVVHYPHQPDKVFSGVEGGVLTEQIGFVYDDTHWQNPSVSYYVNLNKQNPAFLNGIINSFAAWNTVSTQFKATYKGTSKSTPGTLQAKWNPRTGNYTGAQNVVGFRNISQYPDAIGITYYWRILSLDGYHIVEVDTVLNTISTFKWWQTTITDNPNNNSWPANQITSAYDVDVQNIMTHEAGHWLVLGDLYDTDPGFDPAFDGLATMFGYASQNELQKRSLEAGDIAGIKAIYGSN